MRTCCRSGNIRAWQEKDNWTRFTHDEQITLMTLWCIARSPLIMGGNMPKNDAFTLSLLTNDEVIAVNQASTNNRQILAANNNTQFVWAADVPGSRDRYVAIFNAASSEPAGQPSPIAVPLADIGLTGPCQVRDLWAHKDLGRTETNISATVNPHGAVLYRIQPLN